MMEIKSTVTEHSPGGHSSLRHGYNRCETLFHLFQPKGAYSPFYHIIYQFNATDGIEHSQIKEL